MLWAEKTQEKSDPYSNIIPGVIFPWRIAIAVGWPYGSSHLPLYDTHTSCTNRPVWAVPREFSIAPFLFCLFSLFLASVRASFQMCYLCPLCSLSCFLSFLSP